MNSNCKDSIHTSADEGVYDSVATSVATSVRASVIASVEVSVRDKLLKYEF
jgi:hypothetical protein